MINRKLFISWIRATWFGWLLGIPIVIAFALIGEAVHIGGAQFLVGAGMGTGIGLMQARVIRSMLHKSSLWILSCVVGLGAPFLLTDLSKVFGWNLPYSLPMAIALGGLIVGIWQALMLRSRFRKTGLWIVASTLGWTLAAGTSAIADSSRMRAIRGIWGAVAYLGIVAAGGLVLGIVTGPCLAWMIRDDSAVVHPDSDEARDAN